MEVVESPFEGGKGKLFPRMSQKVHMAAEGNDSC